MAKPLILAIGAHPDDVELGCSGTLLAQQQQGCEVVICDLTQGELGTRGTVSTRKEEAVAAAKVLGVRDRINLGFADGFFQNDKAHQLELIKVIRQYRPDVIFTNAVHDRHPDHARAAELTETAAFLSGLVKIDSQQIAHRPRAVYHYIQALNTTPHFTCDISKHWEQKVAAIRCYGTQFHDPDSSEPETFISTPQFLKFVEARAIHFGLPCGFQYAEGFTAQRTLAVKDVMQLW